MGALLEKLVVPMPDLRTLAGSEAKIIIALRLAIIAHKTGQDCRDRLDDRLGSRQATTRLLLVVETVGYVWPEAFKIGCPCSPKTTPDEILFLNMMRHVVTGNRPTYDRLLCEMIDDSARARIWYDVQNFADIYFRR